MAGLFVMFCSLLTGALFIFGVHVVVDELSGVQREMRSAVGLLFVPVLALPLAIVACLIHAVARRWFKYASWRDWVGAGFLHALLFVVFTSPWLLVLPLFINVVTLTWWRKRQIINE